MGTHWACLHHLLLLGSTLSIKGRKGTGPTAPSPGKGTGKGQGFETTAGRQALLVSVSVQLKNVTSNEELLLEAEISRQLLKSMTAVNISEGGRNRNLLCGQQQESR